MLASTRTFLIVVPAQAGVILPGGTSKIIRDRGPRTGGGDPIYHKFTLPVIMWSPHRRG